MIFPDFNVYYDHTEMTMAKVNITETVLRDAHQSLLATRMTTDEFVEILPAMDRIGYYSIECWGGATFDACLRFLDEDPWERLRKLRKGLKNTKLQMLFRGQNMLGYRHYADDVVEYFVQKSIANGIDIIRIFDALNDIRNLKTAISAAKREKHAEVQVAISYTTGKVFTDQYYVDYAKQIEEAGADSICVKDMAALLTPVRTAQLVRALKQAVSIPIQLHTHSTSGLASICLSRWLQLLPALNMIPDFRWKIFLRCGNILWRCERNTSRRGFWIRSCWRRIPGR